jgi:hypothetical protein
MPRRRRDSQAYGQRSTTPWRLNKLGATVVDEVVNYEDVYRLCYIRGPEGILIGLAQQLGQQTSRENAMDRKR